MTEHQHDLPQLENPDDGTVLGCCEICGATALTVLQEMEDRVDDADARWAQAREALAGLVLVDDRPLFHWSLTRYRKSIIRHGLRPGRKPTVSSVDPSDELNKDWRSPVVCFADSPSWAWGLSGGMSWTPTGEWDLWQTRSSDLIDPIVLPDSPGPSQRPSGIYEVRTQHAVRKRHLWLVGSRSKPSTDPTAVAKSVLRSWGMDSDIRTTEGDQ